MTLEPKKHRKKGTDQMPKQDYRSGNHGRSRVQIKLEGTENKQSGHQKYFQQQIKGTDQLIKSRVQIN